MNRLKERRKELGLTQEQLAKSAGVSRYTIIKLERGEKHAHWWTLKCIADALFLSVPEIFCADGDNNS